MRKLLKNVALYAFHLIVARPVLHGIVGVGYRGRRRMPRGACLVVSNHNSHLDAAVLMSLFPLKRLPHVHPVAAADYFGTGWFKKMLAMLFMNGVPIERRPSHGRDPLAPIADLLEQGESLIFFPEGSRGEAGVVARFRPGVGVLARSVPGLLVVPVFLSGPERIWPRGNVVPVPLSIDASVGRPRSYPSDMDPRAIAEQVREDVLALAPPPPPVPGLGADPPLRVSVCSVDGELRDEVLRATVARLGQLGPSRGVGSSLIEADAGGLRESPGPVPVGRSRLALRILAGLFRTRGRHKGRRFADMVERAQIDEALGQARDTRFVVQDGSALVDLLVGDRADLHDELLRGGGAHTMLSYLSRQTRIPWRRWWRFLRHAPEVWLVNTFNLVQPPVPDVLVLIHAPAGQVTERLRSRGVPLESFETEEALERLQEANRRAAELLRKRRKIEILELAATQSSPEEMAEQIERCCRARIEASSTSARNG